MKGVNIQGSLTNQEAHDLLAITQSAFPNKNMLQVLQSRHKYPVMNQWFKGNRMMTQAGKQIELEVLINPRGSAVFTNPFSGSVGSVRQTMATVRAPWRIARSRYDISQYEIDVNRAPARMIDVLKTRRAPAELAMAELMEVAGFQCPTGPADALTDSPVPYGLPYYIVPITGAQVTAHAAAVVATTEKAGDSGQHQGMNPIGTDAAFGDCAGIDSSLEPNKLYRNYNDVWTNADTVITETDVDKMIRLKRHLGFEVPMNATDWAAESNTYRAYASENRLTAMDKKARENNDSLGADLGKFQGQVVVAGMTTAWNEEVDKIASDPWIAVDLAQFVPIVLANNFFREVAYIPEKDQPDVHTTMSTIVFNFFCLNRRMAGGRIDYVAPA